MDKTVPSGAALLLDYDTAIEIAGHEALVRQAYRDSKGVLTWCVGMTNATGHRVERYIGKPASLQHCMSVYVWALDNYAAGVREVFKGHELTRAQFAAALSFHWNTGAIKRATWVKHFKAGDMAAARKAFMSWVSPPEVKGRRQKECDLLFDGKWSNDGTMTEYARLRPNGQPDFKSGRRIYVEKELRAAFAARETPVIDQAPQPDSIPAGPTLSPSDAPAGEPLAKSKRFWTWIMTGIGAPLAAFGALDWRVQLAIVAVIVGFAIYAISAMPQVRKALGLA